VKNPNPITRARRLEMRRKLLGSDRCLYCPESDLACLELDHPVGRKRDPEFTRVVCRNCHRKREMERDLAELTKNGLHNTNESAVEGLRSYLLLLAEDQESIAAAVESPAASKKLTAAALRSTAASLRRKANSLPSLGFRPTDAPRDPQRDQCA
jgi:hypothetical protein